MPALAPPPPIGLDEARRLNAEFESAPAEEILRWAVDTFRPRIAALSSFGASSGALLRMMAEIDNAVPVIFLQTHYHFPETLEFRDELAEKYGLTVENWEARGGRPGFLARYPDDLNKRVALVGQRIPDDAKGEVRNGVDLCCWVNKVEPMRRALLNRDAYLTSLRRDGGSERRARTQIIEYFDGGEGERPRVKVNPLANWSKRELWKYIHDHGIPTHPLWAQGYKSIGCAPCTAPVGEGEDERAGRWAGAAKNECGIHTSDQPIDFSI